MEALFSDLLRGLLLLIGVVFVVSVYLFSRQVSSRRAADDAKAKELSSHKPVQPSVSESGRVAAGKRVVPQLTRFASSGQRPSVGRRGGERVLVLHVRAPSGSKFTGEDILCVAVQAKLERTRSGEGEVFECPATGQGQVTPGIRPQPLFYVTNMFSPGSLDFQRSSFATSGLSLFTSFPGVLPPLEVFDRLLACARLFADGLRGTVLDEHRRDLTPGTIQAIRDALQTGTGD